MTLWTGDENSMAQQVILGRLLSSIFFFFYNFYINYIMIYRTKNLNILIAKFYNFTQMKKEREKII